MFVLFIFIMPACATYKLSNESANNTRTIGSNATFECNVYATVRLIRWNFYPHGCNEHKVIYNGEEMRVEYKERFFITSDDQSSVLTIRNLTLQDAGKYTCSESAKGNNIMEFLLHVVTDATTNTIDNEPADAGPCTQSDASKTLTDYAILSICVGCLAATVIIALASNLVIRRKTTVDEVADNTSTDKVQQPETDMTSKPTPSNNDCSGIGTADDELQRSDASGLSVDHVAVSEDFFFIYSDICPRINAEELPESSPANVEQDDAVD